jgi:cytochrome c-type biogenesis protein CcmH/NrfG
MSQCEVRAALAGYRSTTVKLGRRSVFEAPDIGTLVLIPLAPGEEPPRDHLVSINTLKAPKKALESYDKAVEELNKEKPNPKKAVKELEKAIEEYPEFSDAWNLLGESRIRMNDLDKAQEALTRAVETDPGFVRPIVTLAMLELERGDLEAAIAASEQALGLIPDLAEARYYQGTAYAKQGEIEKAKTALEQVVASPEEVNFPRAHYILGVLAAQAGDVRTSVAHCRRYLELEPESDAAAAVRKQIDSWKAAGVID